MSDNTAQKTIPYILGLDLGIASVGWAVTETTSFSTVQPRRLRAAGVRVFQAAQVGKKSEAPNLARRLARTQRRRLRRKKQRQKAALKLLSSTFNIAADKIISNTHPDVWTLRVEALDRLLTPIELSRVFFHVIKHRGFKSSRNDSKDQSKEASEYKAALKANEELTKKYRTFGEMIVLESSKPESTHFGRKRNTSGTYVATPLRKLLQAELQAIYDSQVARGNTILTNELLQIMLQLLDQQKSFATRSSILEKVGNCTLQPEFKRSSKHTITFQEFQQWQTLNNTRILDTQEKTERPLTNEEKTQLSAHLFETPSLTFAGARRILKLPKFVRFNNVRYDSDLNPKKKANPESAVFISSSTYHLLKKTLEEKSPEHWQKIKDDRELLNTIATELTLCPTELDLTEQLTLLAFPEESISALVKLPSLTGFVHLSLETLSKILPHLKNSSTFDEACVAENLKIFSQISKKILPAINPEEIRNPVVLRTVTQARKVLKALVKKYGPPIRVHLEMSRDLSRSAQKKAEIEREQKQNQQKNVRDKEFIRTEFGLENPSSKDLQKYRLWKEQGDICAFSGKPITKDMLFDDNQTQIDHALPFSRTLDDSYLNKVLVLVAENQQKRDKSPYEYLNGAQNSLEWQAFERRVECWKIPYHKKMKLLRKDLPKTIREDELQFRERDINDTRYIAKYLRQYMENYLPFSGNDRRRVIVFSGPITAFYRYHWGFTKDRNLNNRHHAIDAAILTTVNSEMLSKVVSWAKEHEANPFNRQKIQFPLPWENFHQDLKYRILEDRIDDFWKKPALAAQYADIRDEIQPLMVSHAPRRKATGRLHEDTFYSVAKLDKNELHIRKELSDPAEITLKNKLATVARHTQIRSKAGAYTLVNRGNSTVAAANGSMIRIDIFEKEEKFFICPVYTKDVYANVLPMKVIKSGKDEKDWTMIDESFTFKFSLWPSDYVILEKKTGEIAEGYYIKTNRSTAAIDLALHDYSKIKEGNGIALLKNIRKASIDSLGRLSYIRTEKRMPLTLKTNRKK